eukprot:CAMPEP_0198694250 /NCGR_PEP_ID=MMETSP1468-20131203/265705_1 /TAXON_ID=1461545 /ORGANISM="Mantoniella sp, Strain CCMP1436" /LENGTH=44 /DNA_ID= /DNA_START= /DNA_END= /DNA_ORIENTATION=
MSWASAAAALASDSSGAADKGELSGQKVPTPGVLAVPRVQQAPE